MEAHAPSRSRSPSGLQAKDTTDAQAWDASRAIAKVEERLTFPGEIKVTVVQEVKAGALAR